MLYLMNWLTYEFWTRTGGWEFDSLAWCWHILSILFIAGRGISTKTFGWTMCFLLMTFVPVQKLCVNIYLSIRMQSLYEFCYRTYIYIHNECRSVLVKLHPITVYRNVLEVCGSCVECHFLFSLVSPIVSCSMINRLLLGCLWPLVFVLNNILTLGIWRSAISHLPGLFCPWTFFQNIGFNI